MGGFKNFLLGAGAGAEAGGLPGAIFGGLGGLFGGGDNGLRDLTPGEKNILAQIEKAMPGLLNSLGPDKIQALAKEFSSNFTEEGLRQVGDVFSGKKEQLRLDQMRTGGVLGTVGTELSGRLGREESLARSSVVNNANLAGQQVAQSILGGRLNTLAGLQGTANSIYQSRMLPQGASTPQEFLNSILQGGLAASISPYASHSVSKGLRSLYSRVTDNFGSVI